MIGNFASFFRQRQINPWVVGAYLAIVMAFAWILSQFYIPGKGFSYFISFGSSQEVVRLSKVRKLDYYMENGSAGYDAQFYVQIAMDPSLQNRQLRQAVDSLPYRARRILFATTAYVFGLGTPALILQAYALQNSVCWFLLATLLLHWFPPRNADALLRWAGVLFSLGLCLSFRSALYDGPSLLVIAFGVYLLEKGCPWWSTIVLGIGGLGKETNLLGALVLLPRETSRRSEWTLALLRGLLVAAPLALWILYIAVVVGPAADPGVRNFGLPFAGYFHKWQEILATWKDLSWSNTWPALSMLMMLTLTAQFTFLLARPQWQQAWWRIGASFALLMVFLGDAVWEGYPGAAARVLLPMQLAFNVLVPVGRTWRAVLLAGNLGLLAAPFVLLPPVSESYVLSGSSGLLSTAQGKRVFLQYLNGWHQPEGWWGDFGRWAQGNAVQKIQNPHSFALRARLRFSMFSAGPRTVRLKLNGTEIWQTKLTDNQLISASLSALRLEPGESVLEWETDEPAIKVGSDPRDLAFVLRNLHLDILREAQAP